jgi:glc operon protein GlcG
MRNLVRAAAVLALTSGLASPRATAQSPAQGPQGGAGSATASPQTMDLASAITMAAAAEAAAAAANAHVAICVMDTNGDVVLLERMNQTGRLILVAAQGKARAVLLFGVPTGQIADAVRDKKPVNAVISSLPLGNGGEITLLRGGLPVMKDGRMIGTIGVGGSTSETDEKFAQAGIDALNTK